MTLLVRKGVEEEWRRKYKIKKTPKRMAAEEEMVDGREEECVERWEIENICRRTTKPSFDDSWRRPRPSRHLSMNFVKQHPGTMRIRKSKNKHRETEGKRKITTNQPGNK
jgi:hypothetical protein